jgi:O-antigen/teichoic acid export membrane protein
MARIGRGPQRILACGARRHRRTTIETDQDASVAAVGATGARSGGATLLAFGGLLARGSAFAGIVIITRLLSQPDVAIVLLAQAASQYLLIVMDFGLTLTGIRAIAAAPARVREVMGGTLVIRLGIGLLGATVILVGTALLGATPATLAVVLGFCLVALASAADLTWVGQVLGSTTLRAAVTTGGALAGLALTAALVTIVPAPLTVVAAQLAGAALAVGLGLRSVIRRYGRPIRPTRTEAGRLILDSIPLGLASLLAQVYYNFDLLLIAAWRPIVEVATYGAAYKIIFGLLMLGWTYAGVALPRLTVAHRDGPDAFAREIGRDVVTVLAWSVPIAIVVALASLVIMTSLFGAPYASGAAPLTILVVSVPIAAVRIVILYSFTASGRPWAVPVSSGPGAAINLGLNLALIPTFGMVGAAVTTVVAELAVTAVAIVQARATLRQIPWRLAISDVIARAATLRPRQSGESGKLP